MVQFSRMMSKMSLITMICQILKMLMKVHMKVNLIVYHLRKMLYPQKIH